ncbi:DNA polymerase IV [Marinicella gelatinilytica]|uniref:DNA polymerase IV n=1 Tax=Marinicella gelatinilytica TaxID=2996017 RepID=UPI002260F30D|nr:DNA polymerase IV [Marinicella gelatinilytica]MCX7545595.1 DNA polymerase IV [Marinicella gelatinilytica]
METVRKIIHIDMDCFYAAIEVRDFPELTGKAIAVGGQPHKRGVVATCSYEAREYGIHSAMPMAKALKLCPDLIIQPVRSDVYRQVSAEIFDIFKNYTEIIQPLSLDEAFLDVTDSDHCRGSATLMAQAIRWDIEQQHNLTASAGIAPNKFLAKIASDWNKPNGQKLITPDAIDDFMTDLAVKKIPGVGTVTNQKMQKLGLHTCADLQQLTESELQQYFGRFGLSLFNYCRGIDNRPVQTKRIRKSTSIEDTFMNDLPNLTACQAVIPRLYELLLERHQRALKKSHVPLLIKALYVKVRFSDFQTTTAQAIGHQPDLTTFQELIKTAWHRQGKPVRLLGLGFQYQNPLTTHQGDLFDIN